MTKIARNQRGDLILMNIPQTNIIREFLVQEIGTDIVENPNRVDLIIETLEKHSRDFSGFVTWRTRGDLPESVSWST